MKSIAKTDISNRQHACSASVCWRPGVFLAPDISTVTSQPRPTYSKWPTSWPFIAIMLLPQFHLLQPYHQPERPFTCRSRRTHGALISSKELLPETLLNNSSSEFSYVTIDNKLQKRNMNKNRKLPSSFTSRDKRNFQEPRRGQRCAGRRSPRGCRLCILCELRSPELLTSVFSFRNVYAT